MATQGIVIIGIYWEMAVAAEASPGLSRQADQT
jgi:hypothetical protein